MYYISGPFYSYSFLSKPVLEVEFQITDVCRYPSILLESLHSEAVSPGQ